MKHFWTSFVEDTFDLDNAIQTKAGFSHAIAVMDIIGGWEEGDEQEKWVGAMFVASMWIFTKADVCNGQRHVQTIKIFSGSSPLGM